MSRDQTKSYLKGIIIGLFLLIVFSYGFFEVWNYLTGPEIIVTSPLNGMAVSESLLTITGQTKNTKAITLNDQAVIIDEGGNFKENRLLAYGYNVLVLRAEDRFGKKVENKLQIVYK